MADRENYRSRTAAAEPNLDSSPGTSTVFSLFDAHSQPHTPHPRIAGISRVIFRRLSFKIYILYFIFTRFLDR